MGIQPKMFHRNSEIPRRRLLLSWWNTGSAQLHRGKLGEFERQKSPFRASIIQKAGGPRNDGPFWKKGDSGFKIWGIHFWYGILDFMRFFLLPENQKRKWMAWLGRDLSFWFRCQLLVVVMPLFSWRKFPQRFQGGWALKVDLKVDLTYLTSQNRTPVFLTIWKYLFLLGIFLCRLDRLIQHHDPDDHLS